MNTQVADLSVAGQTTLTRRRVYILPTAAGMLFVVTLIVMLLGAINYDNSLAYVLTFLVASLLLPAILHTYRNLKDLRVSAGPPAAVFAGDNAYFPVTLDNRPRAAGNLAGRPRYALELQCGRRNAAVNVPQLTAELKTVAVPAASVRRGYLKLGRVRISSRFPLGLFRAWSYCRSDQLAAIYPKPAGPLSLPAPSAWNAEDQLGMTAGAEDFVGFRNYHPGDSIRSIAWKAVARGQPIVVKRFSGGGAQRLILAWEHTTAVGDVESRLSQLCRWIIAAEDQGLRYGLQLPGIQIEPDHGPAHRHRCLLALTEFDL
ncbi:MAG: DUF58 domain-containing protein [Gammaproteobacteria bacterium]